MLGFLLVGAGALTMALVAGALLDSAEESHASPRPHGLDELRRSTLQLDPPPRCCG